MLLRSTNTLLRIACLLSCTLVIRISSLDCAAQKTILLPRVGTIKDYPGTGLMTGCGNLYSYHASRTGFRRKTMSSSLEGDGSNAWMNLGGRDVRLRQLKSLTQDKPRTRRYEYRVGRLRISVDMERFRPETEPVGDNDPMFKLKITLRQGRAVRVVRAVGDSDC